MKNIHYDFDTPNRKLLQGNLSLYGTINVPGMAVYSRQYQIQTRTNLIYDLKVIMEKIHVASHPITSTSFRRSYRFHLILLLWNNLYNNRIRIGIPDTRCIHRSPVMDFNEIQFLWTHLPYYPLRYRELRKLKRE